MFYIIFRISKNLHKTEFKVKLPGRYGLCSLSFLIKKSHSNLQQNEQKLLIKNIKKMNIFGPNNPYFIIKLQNFNTKKHITASFWHVLFWKLTICRLTSKQN